MNEENDEADTPPPSSTRFDNLIEAEDHDFVDETEAIDNGINNYNLSPEELDAFLNPPSLDQWNDLLHFDNPSFITIDSAKTRQWKIAKSEIMHVRQQVKEMMSSN